MKFVSDLLWSGGVLRVFWSPPPIKTDCHDIAEILLKVALNTITLTVYILRRYQRYVKYS
jgi:hypothetical protein